MKLSLSLKLLTTLAILSTLSSQAMAQENERRAAKQERKETRQEQRIQNPAEVRQVERVQQNAFEQNRQNANQVEKEQERARNEAVRNQERTINQSEKENRKETRIQENRAINAPGSNWDNKNRWHNDVPIVTHNKAFKNWTAQRNYLTANIRKFNQDRALSYVQQQQLNAEMQAAYQAYTNNQYTGAYDWSAYSQPQFLDYLQLNQPSLLDRIVGYLGVGVGNYNNNYLYSNDWNTESKQLASNMSRIHQLALEGRISPAQEQELLAQLRMEYSAYKNNNYNGNYGWSEYSDPGFVNYLNSSRPSLLTTIRSYLR